MSDAKKKDVIDLDPELVKDFLEKKGQDGELGKAVEEEVETQSPLDVFAEDAGGPKRQLVLKESVVVDFDHEKHPPLLQSYFIEVKGEDEKIPVKRNVCALLNRLAEMKPETEVLVTIQNYDKLQDEEAGTTREVMKTFVLHEGTVDEALDLLPGLIIPAGEIMNQIMQLLAQTEEFTDATAVMITGVFEKQGVAGFTWANPCLELTAPLANRIYESCKNHADNYKDNVEKQFGFKLGDGIIKADMNDLRKLGK